MLQLAVVLLAIGTLALLLELLIPGFDGFICGIIGIIALVLSAVLAVIFHPNGWIFVGFGVMTLGLLGGFVYNFVTKRQLQGRVILNDNLAEDPDAVGDLSGMVGKEGVAVTILRPYGEAEFNGIRMEVAAVGTMIDLGTKVKVLETQGTKVVVGVTDGN
ncbi:MAG: NfeD family protein [Defluviitaleaceae bacterium]|nr:NfeD family protein [Defluviitaleaceae bacterium]